MTWRSDTFSKSPLTALCLLLSAIGPLPGSTVSGDVRLMDSSNSAVRRRGDFSGVVVWLTGDAPTRATEPRKRAQMQQKDKRFSPHILPIETGTTVDFPNLDPIFHNAFSNFNGKIFDVALYPPGTSRKIQFDRPGIVRVFCNIHPTMSAIIVVVNSPYFATTDRDGHYSMSGVTRGKYQIHFFHERATQEMLASLTRTITVGQDDLAIAAASISEAGYLPVAHKNKYGQDYPPNSEDSGSYSMPKR